MILFSKGGKGGATNVNIILKNAVGFRLGTVSAPLALDRNISEH